MNGYQIKRINEALDNLENLNEWENSFIIYISEQLENYELSSNENHCLNKISEKIGNI